MKHLTQDRKQKEEARRKHRPLESRKQEGSSGLKRACFFTYSPPFGGSMRKRSSGPVLFQPIEQ